MIELVGKPGDAQGKIRFSPRDSFKKRAKHEERELIYGHKCPVCNNLVQAYFLTPQPINLFPYEETVVLSQGEKNAGEILKILPGRYDRQQDTCYNDLHLRGAQRIVLKNHLMRLDAMADRQPTGDGIWEVGERTCFKAGVFSLREDLAVKDLMLFSLMTPLETGNYNIPKIEELFPHPLGDAEFRWVRAVGQAPPMILMNRESFTHGFQYSLRSRLAPFMKQQPVI